MPPTEPGPDTSPRGDDAPSSRDGRADQALVLLGHGSHLNADSSRPVYDHAGRLRDRGLFREVREGFWKEEPALHYVLDTVESRRVYVVPLFLSEGYFTRVVLPRELGISGPVARRGSQTVHYCPPVGTHPRMAELVLERARQSTGDAVDPSEATLLLVGHGTDRHARSSEVVRRLARRLRRSGRYRAVACAFLDEDPRVEEVVPELASPHLVLVPFLVSEGWHTRETLPRTLGLEGERTEREGRVIWYAKPVGTAPEVAEIVVARAREAGAHLPAPRAATRAPDTSDRAPGRDPRGPRRPAASTAREAFLAWIDAAGEEGRVFLQTWVARTGDGDHQIRHVADRGAPLSELRVETAHHRAARSIAATTQQGRHRPLKTAPDLRRGWALVGLTPRQVWEAYHHLYPGAVVHWHQGRAGELETTSYYETAGRQTGIYARVGQLAPAQVRRATAACCDDAVCLRRVRWQVGSPDGGEKRESRAGDQGDAAPDHEAVVPCPQPCSLFVSLARRLLVEREEEGPAAGTSLRPPEREQAARTLRWAARVSRDHPEGPRTGDLADPLNPRRLLYLAQRLEEGGGEGGP